MTTHLTMALSPTVRVNAHLTMTFAFLMISSWLVPSADDQAEYEYNRYPVLFESSNTADNDWPMQEDYYNIDDMPFPVEADGDEIVYLVGGLLHSIQLICLFFSCLAGCR